MKMLCLLIGISLFALGCDRDRPDAPTPTPEALTTAPDMSPGSGDTLGTDDTADRDNTGINKRDAGGSTVTPFDQSNETADIDLVAAIRARVVGLDDLSVNARNVKIITNQGRVVLRGPVASVQEREAIVRVAKELAGETKVTDQLEVDRN